MWNGLWKLTAMVGVIGIGLFAAFQAQKAMNRTAVSASGVNAPGDGVGTSQDETRSQSPSNESVTDELSSNSTEEIAKKESDFPSRSLKPRNSKKKKTAEGTVSFPDNFAEDSSSEKPAEKPAKTSKKTDATVVSAKKFQRKGVDFRDTANFADDDFGSNRKSDRASGEPNRLPDDGLDTGSKSKSRQPIRLVNAESSDKDAGSSDSEVNPFEADLTTVSPENPRKTSSQAAREEKPVEDQSDFPAAESSREERTKTKPESASEIDESKTEFLQKPETPNVEQKDEPGRAHISTDFSADSDPPIRSKRAKKNAVKRVEQPIETDTNPFEEEPKAKSKQPLAAPKAPSAVSVQSVSEPMLGPPEYIEETPEPAPAFRRDPNPEPLPRSQPPEMNDFPTDELTPKRSSPKRNVPKLPAELPDDLNSGLLSPPPMRSREPMPRRYEYDRVTPVDMVGDGEIGDPSKRGQLQPKLTCEKVAPQQAVIDQPLVYSIIVRNTGLVDAHNVVVEDRIPKGAELVGTSPQAEMAGKRLIWNHLVLKPNEEKKISIKVIPRQEGPIGSVATIAFATEVSAEIVVNAPQLEFTVKAPNEVRVGQRFEMVFTLRNIGKVDATNVFVRDLVPDQLKHEVGNDIECPIGKMAPQEVREIVLPVVALKTGSVINKATMTADSGLKKSLDSSIDIIGEVLVLTRTGQDQLYVERPAVFTNNIRNEGNQRADRVKISEVVPAGMEFDSASDGGRYDSNLKAVVWTVGPLAPGNDKSVTVKYVPHQTGTLPAKITATGNAGSSATVNATVDVIGKPELQMETLSATGVVTVGDRITSRFQLNNNGTAAANHVQLRVKLPRELRLISVKGSKYSQKDDYVVFDVIDELAPKTKSSFELVLEPIDEADAQIGLEISADHLKRPGRRIETIQIARDALKQ